MSAKPTKLSNYINEENKEFLEEGRIQQLLDKYCKFLPVPIQFGTRTETTYEGEGEEKEENVGRLV